jgi:hypothetical protein
VFLASYPRSGNTWTKFMLAELIGGTEVDFTSNKKMVPMVGRHTAAPPVLSGGGRLIKTHEPYRPCYAKAIYLVRDVRDVASSFYELRRVEGFDDSDFDTFLAAFAAGEIGGFGSWQDHVDSWLDVSERGGADILVVHFEELRGSTLDTLGRIAGFLGIEVSAESLTAVVENNTAERMRARPSTESSARMEVAVGQGLSGGWCGRLSTEQLEILADAGPTMRRAGYS